jgi:hypothetical protein
MALCIYQYLVWQESNNISGFHACIEVRW